MTRRELISYCLTYQDAYEDYPFDEPGSPESWATMRHRSNKKIFALIFDRGGLCVNLKCEPMRADFLRSAFPAVSPGFHMNKTHWNTVKVNEIDFPELQDMIDISFSLTSPRIRTKK